MEKTPVNSYKQKTIIFLALVTILSSLTYDGYVFSKIRKENLDLKNKLDVLENALSSSQRRLYSSEDQKQAILTILNAERQNAGYIQNQIQDITSTVGQLQKLSKTDVELLKKYSKIYFLNENYTPKNLTLIEEKYWNIKDKPEEILTEVWPKLKTMIDDAAKENINIQILSAYRSFSSQRALKSAYRVTYGYGANKFSADQGYSEHQLGTTVDLTTPKIGSILNGFDKTEAYKWLINNAYKYGFILSYPKDNSYYIFEPWHWRFVGVKLATKLHDEGLNFYDKSQREIDQYLTYIFD